MRPRVGNGWVFSPRGDALAFGGPLVASGVLVALAARAGTLHEPLPPWAFLLLIVGCDVAHVYATLYRTYLDPVERARRPALYAGVPLACLAAGIGLHSIDAAWFWRGLAYLAAFHFVRQAWGFVAYSARKAGEASRLDRALDQAAVYAATVHPLVWWHAHLPRSFVWFVDGDFASGLPAAAATLSGALHAAILGAWVLRQGWKAATGLPVNLAKAWILATTWVAWYGGIVLLDSDLAFTATNVLAHGVPYFFLVRRWGRSRWEGGAGPVARVSRAGAGAALAWYGALVVLAFAEEGLWDRLVSHEHGRYFPGPSVGLDDAAASVVAGILVVPQATHYVLDAFLWRTGARNPGLSAHLGLAPKASEPAVTSPEPAASGRA